MSLLNFFNIENSYSMLCLVIRCVWLFVTPWTVAHQASTGKNTGLGCHFLLQGIFLTQGWDMSLSLLLGQADSLLLHHLRGYSIMSANFNIYISFNQFVSLLWVLFSHLFASLVIFEWMPSNERFTFLDARYFCIPIRLLLWHINLETIWYF